MNRSNGTDWLSFTHIEHHAGAASSSGASFFASQRRARNASDWWWTARDHGKGTAVSPVVSFPPSFERTFSSRERRLGTRQLHQRVEQNLSDMWRSTFETGEAQFRLVTEIVPKSLICVNGSSYECWRTGQGYQVQCTEHSPKFEPTISGKKGSQLELNQICTHNI